MEYAIVIWLLFGIVSAVAASTKGRGGCGWFVLGVLLGPFGLILALVVSPDQQVIETKSLQSGTMKRCPFCAELIRSSATICRFCGKEPSESRKPGVIITHAEKGGSGATRDSRTPLERFMNPEGK